MCAGCAHETCASERPGNDRQKARRQDGRRVDSGSLNDDNALLASAELVDVCAEESCSLILFRLRFPRSTMPARRQLAAASNLRAPAQNLHGMHPGMAKCT